MLELDERDAQVDVLVETQSAVHRGVNGFEMLEGFLVAAVLRELVEGSADVLDSNDEATDPYTKGGSADCPNTLVNWTATLIAM